MPLTSRSRLLGCLCRQPAREQFRKRRLKMRFPLHITTDSIQHQLRMRFVGTVASHGIDVGTALHLQSGLHRLRHGKAYGRLEDLALFRESASSCSSNRAPIVSICGGEPDNLPELEG
jgi:hypothetical protein